MKFKKSHILLISLMSLFLLLGMSAVSAASDVDNLAQDLFIDDISAMGDIDNVDDDIIDANVLSEGDSEAGGDGNTNPDDQGTGENGGESGETGTIIIEASNENYAFGDNITINVSVKDSQGNPIDITKDDLLVSYKKEGEENFTDMNFTYNNETKKIKFVFEPKKTLSVGNYIVNIIYNKTIEDITYLNETNVTLNIRKSNTTLDASDIKVNIGKNVLIPINITLESNKILNVNMKNVTVYIINETVDILYKFNCTNETDGSNVTTGIKLSKFNLTEVGYYNVLIVFSGTDNCNPSNETITLLLLANNTINFNDNVSVDLQTHNFTIPFNVTSNGTCMNLSSNDIYLELTYLNETKNVTETLTNEDFIFDIGEGNYIISIVKDVPLNNTNLTIIYGNNTINETRGTITFMEKNNILSNNTVNVNKHTTNVTIPISVSPFMIIFDDKNITNLTLLNFTKENITLNLTYFNGTENITIQISNDKFYFDGENGTYNIKFTLNEIALSEELLSFDDAIVTIIFANATLNETKKTVILNEVVEAYIEPDHITAEYQSGEFVFILKDKFDDSPLINSTVKIDGFFLGDILAQGFYMNVNYNFTSNETGYIVIPNKNFFSRKGFLSEGIYNITFSDSDYILINDTEEITVIKAQAKIIASDFGYEYGNNLNYTFQLVNNATNEPIKCSDVQFIFKGLNINPSEIIRNVTTDSNGKYTLPSWSLPGGVFNLTIESLNSNIICSSVKKSITVRPLKTVLTAYNRTIYYNSDYSTVVRLNDKKTGKAVANAYVLIRVYISSSKYADFYGKTNKDGKVYLTTPLNVGKHKIIYQIADSSYTASKITRYLTVKKASAKFTASNVTTYYRSGKYYQIKLTNSKNKKAVYYAKMNIKVYISKNRYYNYTGTTDANGLVKFKISYKPGTYKVVISSVDKGYSASAITRQIKVSKAPINITPVSLKVKKGSYFKVKVISTKTKKALSSVYVKVRVYTGRTYKTYSIKTNSQGIASLKIGQSVGKHKVVLSPKSTSLYSAKTVTRTLTVTR